MGLLRMMGRTAVVAGTATAVSGRVARRQQNKAQQKADAQAYNDEQAAPQEPAPQQYQQAPPQYQQAPPQYQQAPPQYQQAPPQYQQAPPQYQEAPAAPPAAAPTDLVAEIQRLSALKDQGILSDAEFTAAKGKLLGM